MTGTTVFGCLPGAHSLLLGPKKLQNQQFYIIDWIRKKLRVDVANLATCCYDDCDVLLEVWEPCANAMLVVLLPKLWFWIENHDWHKCSWMSSWGSLLLGPKKLQNQQFYIIDWIRKKLRVDVANLATCCYDDCDVLLEVWEPCANAMLVVLLPKLWFWIENLDWHTTVFGCLPGAHPYRAQKSFKINNFT